MSPAVLWAAGALALGAAASDARSSVESLDARALQLRVIEDRVTRLSILPGEVTARTVVVVVPDGVVLRWPQSLAPAPAEAAASATVGRTLDRSGGVRWTLTYRFTGWVPGAFQTGELRLEARDGESGTAVTLPSLGFRVRPALPEGRVPLREAPAEGPLPVPGSPWGVAAAAPALLAVVTGIGWLRAARVGAAESRVPEPLRRPHARRAIRDALRGLEHDPTSVLLEAAHHVRRLEALAAAGVKESHTTPEVLERAGRVVGADNLTHLRFVLGFADDVKYGDRLVAPEDLADMATAIQRLAEDV